MLYATFVYAEDETLLRLSSERIRELDPTAKIYAINDAKAPIKSAIPGVQFMSSDHDRGGNLNGLAHLRAELDIFRKLLARERADYIVKFDADTWANRLYYFRETKPRDGKPVPDYLACENWEAFRPSGNFYRVSRWLVDRLVAMYNERSRRREWPESWHYPEDLSIYHMACLTGLPLELIPHTRRVSVGMRDGGPGTNEECLNAAIVHCGEPDKYGRRVSREHATLRMQLLKFETKNYG